MFNESSLLLDDALLKCVVTDVFLFSVVVAYLDNDILGNVSTTHLWCGEIISGIITNYPLILTVKTVWKLVNIDEVTKRSVPIF